MPLVAPHIYDDACPCGPIARDEYVVHNHALMFSMLLQKEAVTDGYVQVTEIRQNRYEAWCARHFSIVVADDRGYVEHAAAEHRAAHPECAYRGAAPDPQG
jgi:hypothetical protein